MKANLLPGGVLVLMLGLLSQALAADGTPACSTIYEDSLRLACYDAQHGKPVRPVRAPQAAPAPIAAAPIAPAPITPAPIAKPEAAPSVSKSPDKMVAGRITEVSLISNGRFAVTLDNGQVWTQLERDPTSEVKVGETVRIRPAMLGSWMLETSAGIRTRVRQSR